MATNSAVRMSVKDGLGMMMLVEDVGSMAKAQEATRETDNAGVMPLSFSNFAESDLTHDSILKERHLVSKTPVENLSELNTYT